MSGSSKAFLVVLVVLVVIGGAGAWWLLAGGTADADQDEGRRVVVEIPRGAGASAVATILAEEGVIRSELGFRLAARFDDRADRLTAGEHELHTAMSYDELFAALSEAPEGASFRVTIPEGLAVDEILPRIAEASDELDEDELVAAIQGLEPPEWVPVEELPEGAQHFEGVFFPETYEFSADADVEDVLARLAHETDRVLADVDPPEDYSPYEVLVVASLVEREARVEEERPTIASVIYNRLEEPMRLQVDATVQYARGEHAERLLFEDLEVDSEWNTYERDGLPPTPISSPGRSAIEAAADPEDTDYLYYVVDDLDTGSHAFAETKEEHDANVREYRRMRDERDDGEEDDD